jgi:hypothetical protein
LRAAAEKVRRGATAEIWRVSVLVWQVLCAALIPVNIRTFRASLPRYLDHLHRTPDRSRPRAAAAFVAALGKSSA